MLSAPVQVSKPEKPVVSAAEAMQRLRIEDDDDIELIDDLIEQATSLLDGYRGELGRCLVTSTWRITAGAWPSCIKFPMDDVTSLAIKYFDVDGTQQDLPADDYTLLLDGCGYSMALPRDDFSSPVLNSRRDAVWIDFQCGYGEPEDVPAAIKGAIAMMVGQWYENPEGVSLDGKQRPEIPHGATRLLKNYRQIRIA